MNQPDGNAGWADRLRAAQDRAQMLSPISSGTSIDIASAYAIADRVHRMRLAEGAVPLGRKIGFTNRNIWPEYGVHQPIWGWMYAHTVSRALGARAQVSLARFAEPKIEPEIVFRFASSPSDANDPEALLACIDWVAHGFEIVQSHFPGWKFQAPDTIADNGLHGALVYGEPLPVSRLGARALDALAAFEVDLACNGEHRDTGRGANVLDSPLNALAHLVDLLRRRPQATPIAAGEIVTTGTLTAAYAVRPGDVWTTTLRGIDLPGLALALVA